MRMETGTQTNPYRLSVGSNNETFISSFIKDFLIITIVGLWLMVFYMSVANLTCIQGLLSHRSHKRWHFFYKS